jgi:dihydroorotate dehydrogenase
MILREIDFGPVLDASGVRNFQGEGYPHHKAFRFLGLSFEKTTLVAKTVTLKEREGNMPLKKDGVTPQDSKPDCIIVKPVKSVVLNAVGLSNFGAEFYFKQGLWQEWPEPFMLSFASVGETELERRRELQLFVEMFGEYIHHFRAPVGLQINFSCPNVEHEADDVLEEIRTALLIASNLQIPIMPKLCVTTPINTAKQIAKMPECDALCVSNTIPWGTVFGTMWWKELFGDYVSPLAHYGGGGFSGAPLLPLVKKKMGLVGKKRTHHKTNQCWWWNLVCGRCKRTYRSRSRLSFFGFSYTSLPVENEKYY